MQEITRNCQKVNKLLFQELTLEFCYNRTEELQNFGCACVSTLQINSLKHCQRNIFFYLNCTPSKSQSFKSKNSFLYCVYHRRRTRTRRISYAPFYIKNIRRIYQNIEFKISIFSSWSVKLNRIPKLNLKFKARQRVKSWIWSIKIKTFFHIWPCHCG